MAASTYNLSNNLALSHQGGQKQETSAIVLHDARRLEESAIIMPRILFQRA